MSSFNHKPVLLAEVLKHLRLQSGSRVADGTLGGAGHAEAMLRAVSPNGFLYGCDRDGAAVEAATERLAGYAGQFEIRRGHYGDLADWVPAGMCDGVLLDLGVSSPQLDRAERGFSFGQDGPLDMRMDDRQSLTAAKLVAELSAKELADLFWRYADETNSRRIAGRIVQERAVRPITTTLQLAGLVEQVVPRHGRRTHPATKVFQALRMAVNDELGGLEPGLRAAMKILKPGGRLAVITFHSLEDRTVKQFGRELSAEFVWDNESMRPDWSQPRRPELTVVSRKAIKPGEDELKDNPRSRSSQLRIFEKL